MHLGHDSRPLPRLSVAPLESFATVVAVDNPVPLLRRLLRRHAAVSVDTATTVAYGAHGHDCRAEPAVALDAFHQGQHPGLALRPARVGEDQVLDGDAEPTDEGPCQEAFQTATSRRRFVVIIMGRIVKSFLHSFFYLRSVFVALLWIVSIITISSTSGSATLKLGRGWKYVCVRWASATAAAVPGVFRRRAAREILDTTRERLINLLLICNFNMNINSMVSDDCCHTVIHDICVVYYILYIILKIRNFYPSIFNKNAAYISVQIVRIT